jgi:HD superfamily phosphohydrolase
MLLVRRLGASLEEQIAALLHDVSHTAFSHVIDSVDHNLLKNGCFARFSRRGFLPPSWARRILA